jgi:hypothetical protein
MKILRARSVTRSKFHTEDPKNIKRQRKKFSRSGDLVPVICAPLIPSVPGSWKFSLSFRFPHQNLAYLSYPKRIRCITLRILHYPITRIILDKGFSLSSPNILLRTLFANILDIYFSLNVRNQILLPYITTDNSVVNRYVFPSTLRTELNKLSYYYVKTDN